MHRAKVGYLSFMGKAEKVRGHMLEALNAPPTVAQHMMDKISHARHHDINGRIVVEDRQISEGGFALVWAARDVHSHEEFAVKKILCQDKESLMMARREIALCERLPVHKNLVKYFGHTIAPTEGKAKEVVLLLEYCSGGHLLDMLDRNKGELSEDYILDVFGEICTAVDVLHSLTPPIQHRDLKVENVLMGSDGRLKLCDFGSWSDERISPSSLDKQTLGTLQEHINRYTTMMYRPPEMVDFYPAFEINEKVDIWMLGCILFTLMFCRHPFQDESPLAIANARYFLPSSPAYSEKLQDMTHWLLARDPADRPSASELLLVLKTFKDRASLRLPAAVVEKRKEHKRLYEDFDDRKPFRRKKEKKDGTDKLKARRRPSTAAQVANSGVWDGGLPAHAVDGTGWPAASVPEPSRAWANFDASTGSVISASSSRSSRKEDEDPSADFASASSDHSWNPFLAPDPASLSPKGLSGTGANGWNPFESASHDASVPEPSCAWANFDARREDEACVVEQQWAANPWPIFPAVDEGSSSTFTLADARPQRLVSELDAAPSSHAGPGTEAIWPPPVERSPPPKPRHKRQPSNPWSAGVADALEKRQETASTAALPEGADGIWDFWGASPAKR